MEPSKQTPLQKETYRLWYDYLKESSDFIRACKDAFIDEKKMGKKRPLDFGLLGSRVWDEFCPLERGQGTAPCPSSGGGYISVDTYPAL